jgi:hypothetical protein
VGHVGNFVSDVGNFISGMGKMFSDMENFVCQIADDIRKSSFSKNRLEIIPSQAV